MQIMNTQTVLATPQEHLLQSDSSGYGRRHYHVPFSERRLALVVIDAMLVLLSIAASIAIQVEGVTLASSFDWLWRYHSWFLDVLLGWWLFAWLNDLYDVPSSTRRTLSLLRLLNVGALGIIAFAAIAFVTGVSPSWSLFLTIVAISLVSVGLWRVVYGSLSRILPIRHRVLVIGEGRSVQAIASTLKEATALDYEVIGYVGGEPDPTVVSNDSLPFLGRDTDLLRLVEQLHADEVVVANERPLNQTLFHLLVECQARGVSVTCLPNLVEKLYRKVPVEYLNPSWALHAMQGKPIFSRFQLTTKRMEDLLIVALLAPFSLLLFPLVALAIRLDSSGPVFYKQMRCGRGGKPFAIFKFRTMTADAEKDGKARWASKNDMRITRVGKFLRKIRLDELPQLINIWRGEMSFVGPRPERPEFVESLEESVPFYRTRLLVKPGLTGWAQVHYDYGSSVEDALIKLQYDFYYVRYWSLWIDLYIIFRTVYVVFGMKGT
jgi:exopolysaccharide biosynthesis polyprenyl glycosylphosphotransferase